jgi:hypothetical protein
MDDGMRVDEIISGFLGAVVRFSLADQVVGRHISCRLDNQEQHELEVEVDRQGDPRMPTQMAVISSNCSQVQVWIPGHL